jgi:hypothetical protein
MNLAVKIAFVVGCFYLATRSVIVHIRHIQSAHWLPTLILVAAFIFSIWEIAWSKEKLVALEDVIVGLIVSTNKSAVRSWYRKVITRMYHKGLSVLTGLITIPVFILLFKVSGWNVWISDQVLRHYDSVSQILMISAATSSQWPFANISRFIMRLPRQKLLINFYAHPRDSIMSLGPLLMKIDLGGLLLTSSIAAALYVSPIHIPIALYLLLIGMSLWAGVWFFVTQFAIHECMLKEKRQDVKLVSEDLMEKLQLIRTRPNPTNQKAFLELKKLYDELQSLPEWPFRTSNVLTLASGVFVPILVMIAEYMRGK